MDRSRRADAPSGSPEDAAGRRVGWILPVALAAVAAALVAAATRDGLGTTPDGVSYLGAASNLAAGRGLTGPFTTMVDPFHPAQGLAFDGAVPFIQWPPLYPAILGVGDWLGVEPRALARLLSVVTLAATVGGVARLVERLAPRAWVPAAAAAAWVLVSPYVALLHVLVASEHVFVALVLLALGAGARWRAAAAWRGGPGWPWAVLATGAASAATLTRYAGAAVVVALAVGVLGLAGGDLGRRLRTAALLGAVGVGPALAWSQLTARQAGVPTRQVVWHPPDRAQWEGVGDTVSGWFVTPAAPTALRIALLVAAVATVALAVVGWRWALRSGAPGDAATAAAPAGRPPVAAEARPWLVLVAAFVVAYLVAVVGTHALLDRAVPISQRLLVPLQPPLAVTVAVGATWWWRRAPHRTSSGVRTGGVAVLAVAGVVSLVGLRSSWWPLVQPGRPWAPDTAQGEVAEALSSLPPDAVIASNDPALAWQSTGRTAIALPVRSSAPTGLVNERFAQDLDELADGLADRHGVVVVYGTSAVLNPHVASVEDLTDAGFEVRSTVDGATVLDPPGSVEGG